MEIDILSKKTAMKHKLREPQIENKYHLNPNDIKKAIILDEDRLHKPPFWRNDVIDAWCLSGGVGKDWDGNFESEYWIAFYDKEAKAYAGTIRMSCTTYGGMYGYKFPSFFNPKDIDCELDLQLQEKLLQTYHWLIEEGILKFPERKRDESSSTKKVAKTATSLC